jgi:hypothetical protein
MKLPERQDLKLFALKNDEVIIEPNLQSRYRSGVGMLLYLDLILETLLGGCHNI